MEGEFRISDHAASQMCERGISQAMVWEVLKNPDQRLPAFTPGREMLQSVLFVGARPYLIRVCVDYDCAPPTVVTVYRTSKISKYTGDPQ